MTKRNSAAKAVAAALVAALTAGAATAPAVALAQPATNDVAIVAQSVGSDDAINAAVVACPFGWDSVMSVGWDYDPSSDDYVVTVTAYSGESHVVWVDAATGDAWAMA